MMKFFNTVARNKGVRDAAYYVKKNECSHEYDHSSDAGVASSAAEAVIHRSDADASSQRPADYDEEVERELLRIEIERTRKIRENMVLMRSEHDVGASEKKEIGYNSRMNACDLTGEEFQIVCEELWVDFKSWVNHHENIRNNVSKFHATITRNRFAILLAIVFVIWFRWYIGAGKDACSYGLGYGVFRFICEVLRHLGEIVVIALLTIIGSCIGLLPIITCACIYEYNEAFPDPDGDADDGGEGGASYEDHLKKE
jgi:hypothetical protein